jgi:hypothetical protein
MRPPPRHEARAVLMTCRRQMLHRTPTDPSHSLWHQNREGIRESRREGIWWRQRRLRMGCRGHVSSRARGGSSPRWAWQSLRGRWGIGRPRCGAHDNWAWRGKHRWQPPLLGSGGGHDSARYPQPWVMVMVPFYANPYSSSAMSSATNSGCFRDLLPVQKWSTWKWTHQRIHE